MPKFACDDHCGRLARWLRVLGFDCTHAQDITDAALLTGALAEDRVILTRDRRLAQTTLARRVILLASPDPLAQLVQTLCETESEARRESLFTRCSLCNAPTEPRSGAEIGERIPPYVRRTQTVFRQCPSCRRIFWHGTHVAHMLRRLTQARVIPED
ncbi:MAG TPA: Mut7-C RNAse domain-containing protein [candidate division Zixibacteria bacterium]|nr:Mut7-C RNAse domain-containing protein [candidate division Zixibacteria bacterium]